MRLLATIVIGIALCLVASVEVAAASSGQQAGQQPDGFNNLWLQVVAVVALLIVVRLARTEWCWHQRSPAEGNGSPSRDVLTDE